MKRRRFHPLQIITYIGVWIPLAILLWDLFQGNLGPDIIREATLRTGKTALVLLVLSLACTPVSMILNYKPLLKLRRPLGLYSFMYASIHFTIFIAVDYFFDLTLIKEALLEKRFAIVGLTTGLILLVLAITSTQGWKRRLKKRWKQLHKLAYVAGFLATVHYAWLVKQGVVQPWIWMGVVLILLLARIPPVKRFTLAVRSKLQTLLSGFKSRTSRAEPLKR